MIAKSISSLSLIAALALSTTLHAQVTAATDAAAEAVPADEAGPSTQCGFPGAVWIGADAESSEVSGLETALRAELSGAGPFTRVFHVASGSTLRLEAAAKATADPVLRLYTAEGELIAENDDALGSLNSQLLQDLGPGTYCAQVDDLRGAGEMTLQVGPESTTPLLISRELNCKPETEALAFGDAPLDQVITKGALRMTTGSEENSYLRFTLSQATSFSLRADGGTGIDPRMALFDAEGRSIAENDDADGLSARLDFQPELPAGDYCIGLRANEARPGTITVTGETIDVESYKRRAYLRGQLVPLAGDYPVKTLRFNPTQGEIVLQGAGVNWFSFDLAEPSLVGIRSHGTLSGADTMLRLFDGEGELIVENDDNDGDRNARIAPRHLAKGRYFLALSDHQANEATGSPLRPVSLLAERFIRAPAE